MGKEPTTMIISELPSADEQALPTELQVGDWAHWWDEGWRYYRCGRVVGLGPEQAAMWMHEEAGPAGHHGIHFAPTGALLEGKRNHGELEMMTKGRRHAGNG